MRLPDYWVPPTLTRCTGHKQRRWGRLFQHRHGLRKADCCPTSPACRFRPANSPGGGTHNESFGSSSLTCIHPAEWADINSIVTSQYPRLLASFLNSRGALNWDDAVFTDLTRSSHFLFPSSPTWVTETGCFQHSSVQRKHVSVTWEVTRYFPRCFTYLPNLLFSFLQWEILPLGSTKLNSSLKLPLSHTAQCNTTIGTQNLFPYSLSTHWHTQVIKMLGDSSSKRRRHCKVTSWMLPWRQPGLRSADGSLAHFSFPFPNPHRKCYRHTQRMRKHPQTQHLNQKEV